MDGGAGGPAAAERARCGEGAAMPVMYKVRPKHSAGVLADHLPTCMYPLPNLHRAPGAAALSQVGATSGRKDLLRLRPAVLAIARSGMRPLGRYSPRYSLRWEPQPVVGTGGASVAGELTGLSATASARRRGPGSASPYAARPRVN